MAVSLQQPDIRMPRVQADEGTEAVWAIHRRKMRTQEEVARIRRLLNVGKPIWCKIIRRGYEWHAQVGQLREGVRVA